MLVRGATFVGVCQRLTTKILIPHACRPLCSKFTPLPNTGPKITKRESNEENVTKDQTAMEHQPVQFRPSDEFYNAQTDEVKVKLDKLIKQIELLAYVHDRIPSEIGDRDWSRLLTIRTTNGIISHLNYMLINEKKKANDRLKKEARRSKEHKEAKERVIEDMEEREARGEIVYSLSKNNMLLRMSRLRQSITENAKLASMLRLGATPTLLVDCDFLPKLSDKALGRTGVQMQYLLSENLSHVEPWNIDFVNFNRDTERMRDFIFSYLTALRDDLPEEEKSQYPRVETQLINRSYMDLYPREKLIYLSPDAREELGEIDNDSVYILGGIVDVDCMNTVGSPDAIEPRVTLAKAKKDGIKARRLPLDRYVK
uniref:SAM-dependent MTase TRM10-type domain-containing protein n=1 Tax=Plectus sambesii TaxID=2011161 RepID=A0A914XQR6_9BILA